MNLRKLPPMKALIGFEATARLQSVRGAALELNLTHPAISHQLQVLEADLGVKLFAKNGRNIELTEAGKVFHQYVNSAFKTLLEGVQTVDEVKNTQRISIQAYITISIRWLAKRLSEFHKLHPQIELKLQSNNAAWGFDESQADVALIYKQGELASHLHWVELFPSEVYPVCSQGLLEGRSLPLSLGQLMEYPLLTVSSEKGYWGWRQWFTQLQLEVPRGSVGIEVDTLAVALEMAVAGEGIALVNGPVAEDDITSGKLVRPVSAFTEGTGQWGLVIPKRLLESEHIQVFLTWLRAQASG